MVSTYQSQEALMEMNNAFTRLSQGVIWSCKCLHWPKDIQLATNVKIVDWLPQNDLLGKECPGLLVSFHFVTLGLIRVLIYWGKPISMRPADN